MSDTITTPLGVFTKLADEYWHCDLDVNGAQIQLLASDVDGQPDPDFLARVPNIVCDLPVLEQLARNKPSSGGDSLVDEHRIVGIFSPGILRLQRAASDFSLQFHYLLAGRWDEVTFVYFKDNKPVSWCRLD